MATQLEDLLSEGMRRRTVGVRVRPGMARRAYRGYRWRQGGIRAAAVAVPAVAATAAVLASGITGSHAHGTTQTHHPAHVGVRTVGYVLSRMSKALGGAQGPNLVEFSRMREWVPGHGVEVVTDNWAYRARSSAEAWSPPRRRYVRTASVQRRGHVTTLTVSYADRTWDRSVTAVHPQPIPCGDLFPAVWQSTSREAIIQALRCGGYVVAGHQWVDGQPAVKIARSASAKPGVDVTVWVNSATYLPIRIDLGLSADWRSVTQVRWLRPTRSALAKLAFPPIPPGFHRVG